MANQESPKTDEQPKRVDAGDAESVGERKRDINAREARKAAAFDKLLTEPGGREWLWDFMTECYIFHTTYTGNAEGYFREGKRNVGLRVLADVMKRRPDVFATMMKENAK